MKRRQGKLAKASIKKAKMRKNPSFGKAPTGIKQHPESGAYYFSADDSPMATFAVEAVIGHSIVKAVRAMLVKPDGLFACDACGTRKPLEALRSFRIEPDDPNKGKALLEFGGGLLSEKENYLVCDSRCLERLIKETEEDIEADRRFLEKIKAVGASLA